MVLEAARSGLLSDEHFSVDGTLIEAMASIKSFRRRDQDDSPPDDDPGIPWVDFRGEKLRNETHRSRTDPDVRDRHTVCRTSGAFWKLTACALVLSVVLGCGLFEGDRSPTPEPTGAPESGATPSPSGHAQLCAVLGSSRKSPSRGGKIS